MTLATLARGFGLAAVFGITATAGVVAFEGSAEAHSKRVQNACRTDYHRFCPGYKVPSASLRECMQSAGMNISLGCRRALAAEGEIPAKYAR